MSELLFFLLGIMIGGFVSLVMLCCLQCGRINKYEAEIRRLRQEARQNKQDKQD